MVITKYRSGFEQRLASALEKQSVPYSYESKKIEYEKPARTSKYTPDFILGNGVIIEAKGRFMPDDREKHLLIKAQHPELDIRFVFENSKNKISKTSKTTYAMWCVKHGFLYADKVIPKEWTQ